MINNKISELRKTKNISQEELALVLNTSRQAISKWERGETYPDLDKLKDLATYFDVSIDYLLGYDIASITLNNLVEKLKQCVSNKSFDISLDEIKMIVYKNNNNFNLLLHVVNYLFGYWEVNQNDEIVDLVITYCERMLLIYREDNKEDITINDIKESICYGYLIKKRYDLAKDYIRNNDLVNMNVFLAECEYRLGNFGSASKIATNVFLDSISKLINANMIQVKLLLKSNKIEEAYDLAKWSISFIKPIGKNEDLLLDVIYVLTFVKAACEKNLGLDFSETLFFLKNNIDLCLKKKNNLIEINFYSDEKVSSFSLEKDVIQTLYEEIIFLKDTNIYEDMFYMFNEIRGKKNE